MPSIEVSKETFASYFLLAVELRRERKPSLCRDELLCVSELLRHSLTVKPIRAKAGDAVRLYSVMSYYILLALLVRS